MEYTITVKVEDNGEIQLIGADEYIQNKLSIYFSQSYHANKLIETCKKGIVANNLNPIVAKLLKDSEIEKIRFDERMKVNEELVLEKWKREEAERKIKELSHMDTITEKGIQGELFVEEYINKHIKMNNEWSICNISKDGNHNSDLELLYKSMHCVIEVKNIKSKLSESNVKKFREVYIHSKEKEYNSGIFISLLSDFGPSANVNDFSITESNGKFMIYIAKVKENPDKILFAMEVLNQIILMSNNSTEERKKEIIDLLNKQVKNYANLYSEANKALQTVKAMKANIKQYQEEIISFLSSS